MAVSSKIKILCLDGGGIRGLSSLLVLKEIMYGLGGRMKPPQRDLKPCDYFDLIGGTSTGGIIAIMLGRLRMSVQDCIAEYEMLSKKVFSKKKPAGSRSMFYASNLEAAVKEVVREHLGEDMEDALLEDPHKEEACKSVVYTLPEQHTVTVQPQALRTYSVRSKVPVECTIWQAVRATSAALTYFEPIRFGHPPESWVDAGLGFNNPAKALLKEAEYIWRDDDDNFNRNDIGLFLSLGTGIPRVIRPSSGGNMSRLAKDISARLGVPVDVIEMMQGSVTDAERVAHEMRSDLHRSVYHRFNVDQGLQEVELFDYESVERMTADTKEYLIRREDDINTCTRLMVGLPLNHPSIGTAVPLAAYPDFPNVPHEKSVLEKELKELDISELRDPQSVKPTTSSTTASTRTTSYEVGTADINYLWDRLIQADILDRRGRRTIKELIDFRKREAQNHPQQARADAAEEAAEDIRAIAESVECQRISNKDLWAAFKLYRSLRLSQIEKFGPRSSDELWTTHRLGGISKLLGFLDDERRFFRAAATGRRDCLGPEHEAYHRSAEAVARLERHRWRRQE
ncbi:MAG: hypothetical protein M1837_000777 [Sclerophora amabilis]|nr:MAG: hypothetical protein M1837_000777 [Sclerophora amabilis]